MKAKVRREMRRRQRRIRRRHQAVEGGRQPRSGPEFTRPKVRHELARRVEATAYGGLSAIHDLAWQTGLVRRLNELRVLKLHRPYFESDHILNLAYNVLCGGRVLDDIEHRRHDIAFLDMLGARTIPDPTTAGDFCRRFDTEHVVDLMELVNEIRVNVWKAQPSSFLEQTAKIDADGTFVTTEGECKQGIDLNYKGEWGYHPLLVSLANTSEPLYLFNRPGNRPSHEGASRLLDMAVNLCRRAGFQDVLLRGDTDFTQTKHLDRWDADGVRFIFGCDASHGLVSKAEALADKEYAELVRKADRVFEGRSRRKQPRVKQSIVRKRGYLDLTLWQEDVAEFDYSPSKAKGTYRMIVLRKQILEHRGQRYLGTRERYFFYITNDRSLSAAEVVAEANDRCNQERLIEQLKGAGALHAPLNTLHANWAYMVIVSLAWSLKAWFALLLPIVPRWRERHQLDRDRILRMEFRTFVDAFIRVPAQVLKTGRRLVVRFLAWTRDLHLVFRELDGLVPCERNGFDSS